MFSRQVRPVLRTGHIQPVEVRAAQQTHRVLLVAADWRAVLARILLSANDHELTERNSQQAAHPTVVLRERGRHRRSTPGALLPRM